MSECCCSGDSVGRRADGSAGRRADDSTCCCADDSAGRLAANSTGRLAANSICCSGAKIQTVSTTLTAKDMWGACKVRFGIGRMDYKVAPGVYAVGTPDGNSPVLVSANYKLTFDTLRNKLSGLDCWLLILDTGGINVWCAAGKGTFGTDELIKRIEQTGLTEIVEHRKLILPQLGAPNMQAHEVARLTGFSIVYGPVRAEDIKAFITAGCQAAKQMRAVRFTVWDRLVLTPVELVAAGRNSLFVFGVLFLLNLFAASPFGLDDLLIYAGAVLIGTVITPVLLPWIPGRAFSFKGWLLGLIWTAAALWLFGWFSPDSVLLTVGYLLLLPAVSAWLALDFTGASTYTSPSGVLKEMRICLPLIVGASAIGAVLVLVQNLVIGRAL